MYPRGHCRLLKKSEDGLSFAWLVCSFSSRSSIQGSGSLFSLLLRPLRPQEQWVLCSSNMYVFRVASQVLWTPVPSIGPRSSGSACTPPSPGCFPHTHPPSSPRKVSSSTRQALAQNSSPQHALGRGGNAAYHKTAAIPRSRSLLLGRRFATLVSHLCLPRVVLGWSTPQRPQLQNIERIPPCAPSHFMVINSITVLLSPHPIARSSSTVFFPIVTSSHHFYHFHAWCFCCSKHTIPPNQLDDFPALV